MARSPAFVAGHSNAVTGAEEFARALKETDRNLSREFSKANRSIGTKISAAQKSEASAYSKQAAAASAAISITTMRGGLAMRLSSGKVPFALGAEFGAKKYPQFPSWRGNQWSGLPEGIGYWFHPGIADNYDEALDLYMQAVHDAGNRAGLDITNGPRAATAFDIVSQQASAVPVFAV